MTPYKIEYDEREKNFLAYFTDRIEPMAYEKVAQLASVGANATAFMSMNTYQKLALRSCKNRSANLTYLCLGITEEAGEVAGKFKKFIRDGKDSDASMATKAWFSPVSCEQHPELKKLRDDMLKELGDVLWYTAVMAHILNCDLNAVASANIDKLALRMQTGTIGGSGDDRELEAREPQAVS